MNRAWRGLAYHAANAAVIAAFCLGAMALAGKFNGPTRVLLAGECVTDGYGPLVAQSLGPEYRVTGLPWNPHTVVRALAYAQDWMIDERADIIVLHFGLHDIDRTEGGFCETNGDDFKLCLTGLIRLLQRHTDARIMVGTMYPPALFIDRDRGAKDVVIYNKIIRGVAKETGVELVDFNVVVSKHPDYSFQAESAKSPSYTRVTWTTSASLLSGVIKSPPQFVGKTQDDNPPVKPKMKEYTAPTSSTNAATDDGGRGCF